MNDYKLKVPKSIEDTVVSAYQKIENGVVGTYKKIENKFVDAFLEKLDNQDNGDDSNEKK